LESSSLLVVCSA